ncbi:receptor-like protein 56 isoform X3 [Eucalyptus grandis]|uniref:receptor-like protein 56 isoform X3 n=1 Tax=Eucalyptus grandis TaxID=71139 RepID=UPI00192EFD9D|nr:receptor-like protein 56 isoform X3 [Eucalyptus grandis]
MKKKALWALVVIWGITCGSRGCWEQERVALLALNATFDLIYRVDTGGSYFNCCSWEGVECNPTTGRVTHLMLFSSRYYLSGFKTWYLNASLLLPFEELKSLDLFNNHLTGWIAPEEPNLLSSRLSKLEELDLSYNSLDNSILSILGTIPSLRRLSLGYNNLNGTLHVNEPNLLSSRLSKLEELDLNGGFNNLMELDISGNAIDAVATFEGIKNLSHLENLYLDYVHLKHVGTVVQALGALSSLRILSLQHNTIEGTITTQDFHNLISWNNSSWMVLHSTQA